MTLHLLLVLALCQVAVHTGTSLSDLHLSPRHEEDPGNRDITPSRSCLPDNLHYPHHCKVPDCSFMVAWKDEGDSILFNVSAKVKSPTMSWAAIGFSEDTRMVDSDVVVCYLMEEGEGEIYLGLIIESQPRTVKIVNDVDPGSVTRHSVEVKDSKLHCSFSRKKNISYELGDFKSLAKHWHILMAAGDLRTTHTNKSVMIQHYKKAASNCKCDVTACDEKCDCPDGFKYQLLKLHGVLMSVAFIFFIPTGAFVARYYKMVFQTSWFKGHLAMMIIGVLWSLVGLGMVLGHTGGVFSVGYHQIIGITCLGLVVIQPIVGFLRPHSQPVTARRILFNAFHKTMAISILATSSVALFLGTYIFCNVVMTWIMAVLGVSILTNLGFILLLEILTRTHKFPTAPPVGYHKVTKNDDLSESEEEVFVRDDPNKVTKNGVGGANGKGSSSHQTFTMERTLLIIYVLQAFGFAVLVTCLLYYFDSHKHGD